MTPAGWIFIVLSWGLIVCLCGFCFTRVFAVRKGNMKAPLEIDTEKPARPRRARKRGSRG